MSKNWPNVQPSIEQAHRIVRLLGEATPESLAEARRLSASLAETIPQLRQARSCGEYRERMGSTTCLDQTCGRCGPIRQG
ncbi:hypothetical protein [Streptomyces acidiscabies]|uniref:hypothetical protein n=1 Tax=Streptomyces acidiscabies TaxID=42234 RepID=UPI0009511F4E|nr:hypothetical protein [Streptomyces acidiscabies]